MNEKEKEQPGNDMTTMPQRKRTSRSMVLTEKRMESFLRELKRTDRTPSTIESYRQNLLLFYYFLPEDKRMDSTSLVDWKNHLSHGRYSPNSINSRISVVNSFYNFLGKRDWQVLTIQGAETEDGPELCRDEYLGLLREAKSQENSKLYLMIKTMACTDLVPSDLILLTREAVNEGVVMGKMRGADREIILPKSLRENLRDYAVYREIRTGPIFLNEKGKPYARTTITKMIGNLGNDIGLEPGKATPRNLHRLYLNTLADFQRQADTWVADSYTKLLDEEESTIGWRK